jgi:hypothetical protein
MLRLPKHPFSFPASPRWPPVSRSPTRISRGTPDGECDDRAVAAPSAGSKPSGRIRIRIRELFFGVREEGPSPPWAQRAGRASKGSEVPFYCFVTGGQRRVKSWRRSARRRSGRRILALQAAPGHVRVGARRASAAASAQDRSGRSVVQAVHGCHLVRGRSMSPWSRDVSKWSDSEATCISARHSWCLPWMPNRRVSSSMSVTQSRVADDAAVGLEPCDSLRDPAPVDLVHAGRSRANPSLRGGSGGPGRCPRPRVASLRHGPTSGAPVRYAGKATLLTWRRQGGRSGRCSELCGARGPSLGGRSATHGLPQSFALIIPSTRAQITSYAVRPSSRGLGPGLTPSWRPWACTGITGRPYSRPSSRPRGGCRAAGPENVPVLGPPGRRPTALRETPRRGSGPPRVRRQPRRVLATAGPETRSAMVLPGGHGSGIARGG